MKHEFSHTMLHNQRIDVGQNKLKDRFNNLKIVNNENVSKKPDIVVDKGIKGASPRNSEAGYANQKPETPKFAPQNPLVRQPPALPKPVELQPAPVQQRVVPSQPSQPIFKTPVYAQQPRPSSRDRKDAFPVQPTPSYQQQPSKEDIERKRRQEAAKQAYVDYGEERRKAKEKLLAEKRRKDAEDAERKRREREEEERRKQRVLQEKKIKEKKQKDLEKEAVDREKEEKRIKREQEREVMKQDIAQKRKQHLMSKKVSESNCTNGDSSVRNSSHYSYQSEKDIQKPDSRGLGSRKGSKSNLKQDRSNEERKNSRQGSAKKIGVNGNNSEKKIEKPLKNEIPKKPALPQRPPSRPERPPLVEPVQNRNKPTIESQPVLRRMSSNASRGSHGSKNSESSRRDDQGSIISGLTNDRPTDRHLFDYTATLEGNNDATESPNYNFGRTAYFVGENGTAGFNDFQDDIMNINKASTEIDERLFGLNSSVDDTPPKKSKPEATNLDFITVKLA